MPSCRAVWVQACYFRVMLLSQCATHPGTLTKILHRSNLKQKWTPVTAVFHMLYEWGYLLKQILDMWGWRDVFYPCRQKCQFNHLTVLLLCKHCLLVWYLQIKNANFSDSVRNSLDSWTSKTGHPITNIRRTGFCMSPKLSYHIVFNLSASCLHNLSSQILRWFAIFINTFVFR